MFDQQDHHLLHFLQCKIVILKHQKSARTMTVEDWNSVPAPGNATGMLQDGFQVVSVGATLNVGTLNDNPVGVYTGTYTITFDFN